MKSEGHRTEEGWYVPKDLARQVGSVGAALVLTHIVEFEDISNINVERVLSELPISKKELLKHLSSLIKLGLIPLQAGR